ncbi:unnamed protein product [Didymodactylos carnosus]|uniref:Uncharacterized protein n=1 Tax=Didymodactylos carnosus TaxID=1234261 RepID=A0A814H5M1_9BILA|nr:unnamed protein product [Didymodactylos carnosus]CAF3776657.1 unnamed protein product [Didymodactylos carnosus]
MCRRCGKDRNDDENHRMCEIKCHHCGEIHTSIDYICPVIQKYRRELVLELQSRPDLLPAQAQLFILSECREPGQRTRVLENKAVQHKQQLKFNQQQQRSCIKLNYSKQNQWPSFPSSLSSQATIINNNLNETIKSLSEELRNLKENYAAVQLKIEVKYKNHINSISQSWLIMQHQIQTQNVMFSAMNGVINSTLFSTCSCVTESLAQIVNKLKTETNQNDYNLLLLYLQQHLLINEQKNTYVSHQMDLNQLINKQRAALDIALNSIIQKPNGQ